MHQVRSLYYPT